MKVFISWSGDTSHKIARILRDWLPTVIHYVEPWVSSEDIKKGERWSLELSKQLDETSIGIICIDNSNINSPWLNFEAGALSKSLDNSKVIPILFGVTPADIKGPISQFQFTLFDKDDFYKLIKSINNISESQKIDSERLIRLFEVAWIGLVTSLSNIRFPKKKSEPFESKDKNIKKTATLLNNTFKSVKLKIVYFDEFAERAVQIKKFFINRGGAVEMYRLDSPAQEFQKTFNGNLFYRTNDLLEFAVDIKVALEKFGARKVVKGDWKEEQDKFVLWVSDKVT